MTSCIIIDDEKKARDTLEKIILRYFGSKLRVVYSASSVQEGVFAINKHKPDVVFLDIEMPEEDGFQLFNHFDIYEFEVIFTTAYKQYAIDAFKVAALDYLLKPINYIDLRDVLKKLEKKQKVSTPQVKIDKLLSSLSNDSEKFNKVALPTMNGFHMEKANNIIYCIAEESYTKIFTNRNDVLIVAKPLKYIENMLPSELFFRIHKSYIVNMNYIKSYDRSEGYVVTLDNGVKLDVATRRNEDFIKAITRKLSEN